MFLNFRGLSLPNEHNGKSAWASWSALVKTAPCDFIFIITGEAVRLIRTIRVSHQILNNLQLILSFMVFKFFALCVKQALMGQSVCLIEGIHHVLFNLSCFAVVLIFGVVSSIFSKSKNFSKFGRGDCKQSWRFWLFFFRNLDHSNIVYEVNMYIYRSLWGSLVVSLVSFCWKLNYC